MSSPTPDDPIPPLTPSSLPPAPARSELTRQVIGATGVAVDEARLAAQARNGANWFYWVAALSVINSIISLSGGSVSFLAGLAIPQVADAYAAHLGFVGPYFSIGTDLLFAFFFCGFGYLTTHGSRAAFIAGMVLYVLNGAVYLLVSAWLPLAFHGFVLFQMFTGWKARQKLARLRAESTPLAGSGV